MYLIGAEYIWFNDIFLLMLNSACLWLVCECIWYAPVSLFLFHWSISLFRCIVLELFHISLWLYWILVVCFFQHTKTFLLMLQPIGLRIRLSFFNVFIYVGKHVLTIYICTKVLTWYKHIYQGVFMGFEFVSKTREETVQVVQKRYEHPLQHNYRSSQKGVER